MDNATKKRLGQYFSGNKVADLLVSLCAPSANKSVIDPMAGVGDMLSAVVNAGVLPEIVSGIEIDPETGNMCKDRLPLCSIHIGDAFSSKTYRVFERTAWSCVITNPPYVRYQSLDRFESGGLRLKSAREVRQSLEEIISELSHLESNERSLFLELTKHYSGLADLAVPSWILCAALTDIGGKLAMVVPESWISRDYALAVKYMLLKLFNIEYIIEDADSVWFPEALVKTNLLIANRVRMRDNLEEQCETNYKRIRLAGSLAGTNCLVENLQYDSKCGRTAFESLIADDTDVSGDGYDKQCLSMRHFYAEVTSSSGFRKLIKKLNHDEKNTTCCIPKEFENALAVSIPSTCFARLDAWGFSVGQGLRTGANKFFYAKLLWSDGHFDYLMTDNMFGSVIVPVSQSYSLPAFRYQSDIGEGFLVKSSELMHRLILIPESYYNAKGELHDSRDALLEAHISNADALKFESGGRIVRFQDLSAVKPNIRTSDGMISRHWFMLPALSKRHKPQLCISRVNYRSPKCCLINDEITVVDANFSTLWRVRKDEQIIYAVLALLNSTWVKAYLETISTVMGGGALKVEASHLRNLILPIPTKQLIESLCLLGKRLVGIRVSDACGITSEIDHVVLKALLCSQEVNDQYLAMRGYLEKRLNERQR
jgi:hypothetical protein